jgi:hypothetical protein
VVLLVEANLVSRPPQLASVYAWLCRRDLLQQLLEVTIR